MAGGNNQRQQAAADSYTRVLATALSDSDIASGPCRAFITGAAGTLKMTTSGGSTVTLSVQANTLYPIACSRLWSTGTTTATIIAALA